MVDHPPPGPVISQPASDVLPVIPAPPGPAVSFAVPDVVTSLPPEVSPVSLVPDAPSAKLVHDFRGCPHHLD